MRELDQGLIDVLQQAHRRTTLSITLGDSTQLHLSTGTFSFGGIDYEGKLASVDSLNLESTPADQGVSLRISNISGTLGQELINSGDKLDGTSAILGCFFRDETGEWHDEKMKGFIETGDIDGDWINIFFQSLGAKKYIGKTISELFPDEQIPAAEIPVPSFGDLRFGGDGLYDKTFGRNKYIDYREFEFGEYDRAFLPQFELGGGGLLDGD